MKQMFKKMICIALVGLTLATTACAKEEYKKDIDAEDIAEELSRKTPTDSVWIDEDQDFIEEYIKLPETVKEGHVYYAQNTNDLDEFGIFEVEDGQANAVRSMLAQGYLQKRYSENIAWYNSYMPTETPKLRDAEVRVYGNCVAYAVLSPEKRTAFFSECEKLLKNEE